MNEDKQKLLLGCRIKQLRENRKLTQEELCAKINLEQPNLSNIENGKTFPSFGTFLSILEVLQVNPNDVLNFLHLYEEVNISNEIDIQIYKHISNLSNETKLSLLEIIKNLKN